MNYIKMIIMLPLVIFGLLSFMAIDLIRMIQGKKTVDGEWHNDYLESNLNHGQGRKEQ